MIRSIGMLLLLAAAIASAQENRERDVIYGRKHGLALTLDVFKPQKANGFGLVYIASSGWFSGAGTIRTGRIEVLVERGFTVFAVVHGSTPRFTIREAVPDVFRAVRFVRHYAGRWKIDGDRLGAYGLSAGGHLALLVATNGDKGDKNAADAVDRTSCRVQAVAAFFPPTDFLNWGRKDMRIVDTIVMDSFRAPFAFRNYDSKKNDYVPVKNRAEIDLILAELSPVYHVSKEDPPTLLFHGTKDPIVPFQQSELMAAAFSKAGVKHRLIAKQGKRHGWRSSARPDYEAVADWFAEHLKKKKKK